MFRVEIFLLFILCLTLLGTHLQASGPKTNTLVRVLDLVSNVAVILYFLSVMVPGRILDQNPGRNSPLIPGRIYFHFLLGLWAWKSYWNIFPLVKLMVNHSGSDSTESYVAAVCDEAGRDYEIRGFPRKDFGIKSGKEPPCVYIANHGLGVLDDIVVLGALTDSRLSILMNPSAGGMDLVPRNCRERICILPPDTGGRFEKTREILREEILRRGKSMIVFPEDMKKKKSCSQLAPLRTGVLKLCYELGIPVYPLWIHWLSRFPSVFGDTRKTIWVNQSVSGVTPHTYTSFDSFHRECFERLEKLGYESNSNFAFP